MRERYYWYLNTEANRFGGKSPDAQWLQHGRAFVSGHGDARKLQRLAAGDICFMYANTQGVVAVGRVLEPCDGHPSQPLLVYPYDPAYPEYSARMSWFLTFRHNPIPPWKLRKITGSIARQAVQRIADAAAGALLVRRAHQHAHYRRREPQGRPR